MHRIHSADNAATLQTIAERAGVTKSTVYRALRGLPRVSPATVARVRAIAEELHYDPDAQVTASRLALRKHGQTVATQVIAGVASRFYIHTNAFACTLRGITDVLTEQGYSFLITPYQVTSSADTPPIPPWLRRGEMDGLITLGVISANLQGFFAEYRETPAYGHRPLVSIDNTMPGYALVRAASDEGGYQLGQHLLELGHRQLLHSFVPNPYTPENGLVLTGLQRACREAGLDPDHALVSFPIPESWRQPPYTLEFHGVAAVMAGELTPAHALFASLAAHPGVTAYCAGNAWAVRAWYLLEHFGWRIPEQLSIVGMSDSDPYPDASGRNLLTSVAVDRREEGREAAQLLLRLIADGVQTQETVVVPTTLVIRSSTAPPAPR